MTGYLNIRIMWLSGISGHCASAQYGSHPSVYCLLQGGTRPDITLDVDSTSSPKNQMEQSTLYVRIHNGPRNIYIYIYNQHLRRACNSWS